MNDVPKMNAQSETIQIKPPQTDDSHLHGGLTHTLSVPYLHDVTEISQPQNSVKKQRQSVFFTGRGMWY